MMPGLAMSALIQMKLLESFTIAKPANVFSALLAGRHRQLTVSKRILAVAGTPPMSR